MITLRNFN